MAMSAGTASGGLSSDINVTPMIDVLLVLLIIFMITQPLSRMTMRIQVPPPEQTAVPPGAKSNQIVLELGDDGSYEINSQPVPVRPAGHPAARHLRQPSGQAAVPQAGRERMYQDVIQVMDIAHGAGVQVIGFTPVEAYAK